MPIVLRVICAWCDRVLKEGAPNAPTSHGLCLDCSERLAQETA